METLFAIGVGQGITLSFLLFFKSSARRNASWLMGVFIFCVSAYISAPLLNSYFGEPKGSFIVDPFLLLLGPSFYGYILSLSGNLNYNRFIIHVIPFVLYIPLLFYFYHSTDAGLDTAQSLQQVYSSFIAVSMGVFKFLYMLFYVGLSFYALHKHQEKIKTLFANLDGKDLKWIKYMLYGFLVLCILSFLIYLVALQLPEKQALLTTINLFLLLLFLATIALYTFKQQTVFDVNDSWLQDAGNDSEIPDKTGQLPKYEKSGLKIEEIETINEQLEDFVHEKGFINPEITLTNLAEQLKIAPHKLSEVLSKHRNSSFYDFINYHRVEAVKSALIDPKNNHLSVLGIAYDCGYNSKSTFNSAFKKFTGLSPTEYRRLKHSISNT